MKIRFENKGFWNIYHKLESENYRVFYGRNKSRRLSIQTSAFKKSKFDLIFLKWKTPNIKL